MTESHKKGCLRKGCVIPAASIALLVAIFVGREVYLAFTAEPGAAVDYHALAEELVASHQPAEGENGWGLLVEALDRMQQYEQQSGNSDDFGDAYDVLRGPTDPTDYEGGQVRIEELKRIGTTGLVGMREAGVWDLLDQLADSPRVVRPLPGQEMLMFAFMPELGHSRSLADIVAARMRLSHAARDEADVVSAFRQGCGLVRTIMLQYSLMDHLIGMAVFAIIDDELRYELTERPMDDQSLVTIAEALDRLALIPPEIPFQGERLMLLDLIQRMHTDDGNGNGRRILSREWNSTGLPGNTPAPGSWLPNLGSIAHPSKKQVTDHADRFCASAVEAAKTPRRQRDAIQSNPEAWVDRIPERHTFLRELLPDLGVMFRADDFFNARLAGSRTMIAIERFRVRDGVSPQTLDQLVPDFLASLPIDPFADDGRFIYRRIDAAADPHGRHYLLYSVGYDSHDDDGNLYDGSPHRVFQPGYAGTDFVFNQPRPSRDAGDN